MQWERDMEEAMELIYRLQVAHGGRLAEREACETRSSIILSESSRVPVRLS